ncbi:hypothetical protein JHW43_009559 [Diplocarpon mali]|nr:hypothetical protein JHW43_009559 [Diplocarpon mali]
MRNATGTRHFRSDFKREHYAQTDPALRLATTLATLLFLAIASWAEFTRSSFDAFTHALDARSWASCQLAHRLSDAQPGEYTAELVSVVWLTITALLLSPAPAIQRQRKDRTPWVQSRPSLHTHSRLEMMLLTTHIQEASAYPLSLSLPSLSLPKTPTPSWEIPCTDLTASAVVAPIPIAWVAALSVYGAALSAHGHGHMHGRTWHGAGSLSRHPNHVSLGRFAMRHVVDFQVSDCLRWEEAYRFLTPRGRSVTRTPRELSHLAWLSRRLDGDMEGLLRSRVGWWHGSSKRASRLGVASRGHAPVIVRRPTCRPVRPSPEITRPQAHDHEVSILDELSSPERVPARSQSGRASLLKRVEARPFHPPRHPPHPLKLVFRELHAPAARNVGAFPALGVEKGLLGQVFWDCPPVSCGLDTEGGQVGRPSEALIQPPLFLPQQQRRRESAAPAAWFGVGMLVGDVRVDCRGDRAGAEAEAEAETEAGEDGGTSSDASSDTPVLVATGASSDTSSILCVVLWIREDLWEWSATHHASNTRRPDYHRLLRLGGTDVDPNVACWSLLGRGLVLELAKVSTPPPLASVALGAQRSSRPPALSLGNRLSGSRAFAILCRAGPDMAPVSRYMRFEAIDRRGTTWSALVGQQGDAHGCEADSERAVW